MIIDLLNVLTFKKTPLQVEAIKLITKKESKEILLLGGSRSGKTFIIIYFMIVFMLKYPNSKVLSIRKHFNHAKASLFMETFPDVAKLAFPNVKFKENRSDWYMECENGSRWFISGMDDSERTEKILGRQFDILHFNEVSELVYKSYELFKTRLNPKKGLKGKVLLDYNPPSTKHWGYKVFEKNVNPETGEPLKNKERYKKLVMNPKDNLINLSEDYLDTLNNLSEAKRMRFLEGKYSDGAEGSLWKWEWIINNRVNELPKQFNRIVIAVDPAVTSEVTSDETGIIVAGEYKGEYYIIADETIKDDVAIWGKRVCELYDKYQANNVIAESNQGGDLIAQNIRNYNRNIPVATIHAKRGKALRAEPVAELYSRGKVHHKDYLGDAGVDLSELEDELTTWVPSISTKSPNRLDALVYAIIYLSGTYSFTGKIKLTGV